MKGGGKGERRKEKGENETDRDQGFSSGNHDCRLRHL